MKLVFVAILMSSLLSGCSQGINEYSPLVVLSTQESVLLQTIKEFGKMAGHEVPNRDQELYNQLIELRKSFTCK